MEGVRLEILPQPDDTTCGPTCLHAVYRHFDDHVPLDEVIAECRQLDDGGTLAPLLGCHALQRGYRATLYTYNVKIFDPTWFADRAADLERKLLDQMAVKEENKLQTASKAYVEFLRLGGRIKMSDLTRRLLRKYLNRSIPILVGLSATYLYRSSREYGPDYRFDDVRGVPVGHFVVLCGYDRAGKMIRVADPYLTNPFAPKENYYAVGVDRVVCAILLGILTYDANLLIIEPRKAKARRARQQKRRSRTAKKSPAKTGRSQNKDAEQSGIGGSPAATKDP